MPDIQRYRRLAGTCLALLMGAGLAAPALAEPCNPEDAEWIPSRYYPEGSVVYYQDTWYESRALHEGKQPGITFDWRELRDTPECGGSRPEPTDEPAAARQQTRPDDQTVEIVELNPVNADSQSAQPEGTGAEGTADEGLCETPDPWLFARSYTVGSLTTHGGMVWEAIRPTNGDMPGTREPPRWEPVPEHCANTTP